MENSEEGTGQAFLNPRHCSPLCVCASRSLPVLQPETYRNLITALVTRAPIAVRPHLERKVFTLRGREAELEEEVGFAGQGEDLRETMRPGLEDQRLEQRAAEARPLPVEPDREPGDFAESLRIDLQRSACDDLPTGR